MAEGLWVWVVFNLAVLGLLALDLGVFHRDAHEVKIKEALTWSVVWIALSMAFNLVLFFFWETIAPGSEYTASEAALAFFTGYIIEKSLSVDNIFVFVLIFSAFAVPAKYQHRVLFWGIVGALIMRGIFIGLGAALLNQFHWIIYVFGAFLLFTGIRMALQKHDEEEKIDPEKNPLVRLARRFFPITPTYEGQRFFVRKNGVLMATPLFLVLIMVETTDLVFAVDSIPAIFAVTQDPFLVYTSNVCAILGLRALYFVLANAVKHFVYLKPALSAVLIFVGIKMLLVDIYHMPPLVSLSVIGAILGIGILASLVHLRRVRQAEHKPTSGL